MIANSRRVIFGLSTALLTGGLAFAQAPSNDLCSNPQPQVELTFVGNSTGAATDGAASCGGTNDIWFVYNGTGTGTLSVDTCGSEFDTVLTAYDSCGGAELACDDNSGCGNTSQISFAVTPNTSYLLRVAGVGGATGKVVITASVLPSGSSRPANDSCANATQVGDGTFSSSTEFATTDGFASCVTSVASGKDIWWKYVAPSTGTATLDTLGSDPNFDTVLAVFDACDGNTLKCNDDADSSTLGSRVTLSVTQGTSYLVRVAGSLGLTGNVTLTIKTTAGGNGNGNDNTNSGGNDNTNSGGNGNTNSGGNGNNNSGGGGGGGNGNSNGNSNSNGNNNGNDGGTAGDIPQCNCGQGGAALSPLTILGVLAMKANRRRFRSK